MPTWLKAHPGSALITGCRHFVAILCSYFAMSKQCLQPAQRLRFRRAECSSPSPLSSRMSPVPTPTHSKHQHTLSARAHYAAACTFGHGSEGRARRAYCMVGRPCGQFHGCSSAAIASTILPICRSSSASPIMTADLPWIEYSPVVEYPESQIGALQSCAF